MATINTGSIAVAAGDRIGVQLDVISKSGLLGTLLTSLPGFGTSTMTFNASINYTARTSRK